MTNDYDKVKVAILQRLEVLEEIHRYRFRARKRPEPIILCRLGPLLHNEASKWLCPRDRTPEELLKWIVLKQFIWDLKDNIKDGVQRHKPQIPNEQSSLWKTLPG